MMKNGDCRAAVVQNLKDAGCDRETIEAFLLYFDQDEKEKQLDVLKRHRNTLLTKVHKEEKKIYCLDYLIYQIGRCQ